MQPQQHVCLECGQTYGGPGKCQHDGAGLVPWGDDPLLGQTIGSWRIARLLGAGGMGRVYKAVQPSIGGRVAVKVLVRECAEDRELVNRFFSEARAVNLIRHENIVNVLDLATLPDGRPYIVMEYLDGAPLSQVIKQRGPLPMGGLARLMGEVLSALGAAHHKGIVHRDLKPDNIYVTPGGHARVLDFGIAKLAPELDGHPGPTRTGSLLGTPQYMSPEQAAARAVDARADIYACGIILFEGLTGQVPFTATSLFELLRQHIEVPPPKPRTLRPDIPMELEAVILQALEKSPDDRFSSAHAMAQALSHATRVLPPQAWTNIGLSSDVVSVGPSSVPSGEGVSTTSSSSAGQVVGRAPTSVSEESPKRSPLTLGLAALGLIAAGAAVAFGVVKMTGGDEASGESVQAAAPAEPDADTATLAGGGALTPTVKPDDPSPTDPPPTETKPADPPPVETKPADTPRDRPPRDRPPRNRPPRDKPPRDRPPRDRPAVEDDPPAVAETDETGQTGFPDLKTPPSERDKGAPLMPYQLPKSKQPSFKNLDVHGYMRQAAKMAREFHDDARLVRLMAYYVAPNGRANLTLGQSGMVIYQFRSKKASVRGDTPRGVQLQCMVAVNVMPAVGVTVAPYGDDRCEETIVGFPRCTPAQVWQRAIDRGAPTDAVATLMFGIFQNKAQWMFTISGEATFFIADDCD